VGGIDRLRLDAERATLLLLCMEEAPGDCHRHHAICGLHFPAAVHIFRDEQFTAKTLQDALDAGDAARLYGETAYIPLMRRSCGFRFNPAGSSDLNPAGIPIWSRPPFRDQSGHHSDLKPATPARWWRLFLRVSDSGDQPFLDHWRGGFDPAKRELTMR
jgi:hypothetical protein